MTASDPKRQLLDQLMSEMAKDAPALTQPPQKLRYLYAKVISSLIVEDEKTFSSLVDEYVQLLIEAGVKDITENCLLSLKNLCDNWPRARFSLIVQQKLDALGK